MANKNTTRARKAGYCSHKDYLNDGNKIYKGDCCDTAWNNKNSKHRSRKIYKKQVIVDED